MALFDFLKILYWLSIISFSNPIKAFTELKAKLKSIVFADLVKQGFVLREYQRSGFMWWCFERHKGNFCETVEITMDKYKKPYFRGEFTMHFENLNTHEVHFPQRANEQENSTSVCEKRILLIKKYRKYPLLSEILTLNPYHLVKEVRFGFPISFFKKRNRQLAQRECEIFLRRLREVLHQAESAL